MASKSQVEYALGGIHFWNLHPDREVSRLFPVCPHGNDIKGFITGGQEQQLCSCYALQLGEAVGGQECSLILCCCRPDI